MATLKLTPPHEVDFLNPVEGDLHIVDNRFVILEGREEVMQAIRCRLRMFRGEWFLDQREGIPYLQEVFRKVGTDRIRALKSMFRAVITATPGVSAVPAIDLVQEDVATRAWSLTFAAELADGGTVRSSDYGPFLVTVPG